MDGDAHRAGFRDVLADPQVRALWLAQILSTAGDQVARVALTLLVYDRTRSALLAALTFVMGMLPAFVGGTLLAGLGDRLPRRTVMVACDLIRTVLVAIMLVPGLPLGVLVALLFAVTAGNAPFTSARSAIYPELLTGDRYVVATALTLTTSQFAQVSGFAVGGVIAAAFGTHVSLLADAVTFAVSALLIRFGVGSHPAPSSATHARRRRPFGGLAAGARLVFSTPALRVPMLLAWLAAAYNAPEGVATPFARELGGGAGATGLLLAAPAFGYTIGALAFGRMTSPVTRSRLMGPLAFTCCALLIFIFLLPDLLVTLLILASSGACACYQVAANADFVAAAPANQRSQATGLAIAGLSLGQGFAMVAAGAAAQHFRPTGVVAVVGALGAAVALALSVRRLSSPVPSPTSGQDLQ